MKVKFKSKLSRALSLLLAANITLTCATSNMAYAAKTSSVMGSDSYLQQADITVGSTYSFGGYNWIAAEASGNKVILQSKGITSGAWPGYKMPKWWFIGSIKFIAPIALTGFCIWNLYSLFAGGGIYGKESGYPLWSNIIGGWAVTFLVFVSGFIAKVIINHRKKNGFVDEIKKWD